MEIINIYTDGSCYHKTRNGGAGIVLLYKEEIQTFSIPLSNTTVGRAELIAAITALSKIKPTHIPTILFSDSMYVVNNIRLKWIENAIFQGSLEYRKNADLLIQLYEQYERFDSLELKHVKGHSGVEYNELADQLASKARKTLDK